MDRRLHRPVAAWWVRGLLPLRVSANHATLARVFSGWAAGYFLYRGFFMDDPAVSWLSAAALLFVSMVLDCADGQLARARGEVTPLGRILDGVADVLVVVPFYAIMAAGVFQMFGGLWLAGTVVAGFSFWAHTIVHDKMKALYGVAEPGPADTGARTARAPETGPVTERGHSFQRFLTAVYALFLRVQGVLMPVGRFQAVPEQATMRGAGLLGLGTHTFVLYTGVALMVVDVRAMLVVQGVFALLLNAVVVFVFMKLRTVREPERGPIIMRTS